MIEIHCIQFCGTFVYHMDEVFELPVSYRGKEILLPAQLTVWGYSHRITVTLHEQEIIFEPDEERNYRAVMEDAEAIPHLQMLQAIAASLEAFLK